MKKSFFLMFLCALFLFATQANAALILTPSLAEWSWTSTPPDPVNPKTDDIEDITGESPLFELYKADVGTAADPIESGPLAGSIETEYKDVPLDPSGADITFTPTGNNFDFIHYLLVKDGNNDPRWYLFDLFDLNNSNENWDGSSDIKLQDFWPDQGSISHIAFYGVPIPGAVWLLGSGLVAMVAIRRRRKS